MRISEWSSDVCSSDLHSRGGRAVLRFIVELPVAGVEDAAVRRLDHERITFGDRMRQRHVAYAERADLELLQILDHVQLHFDENDGLFQLGRQDRKSTRLNYSH